MERNKSIGIDVAKDKLDGYYNVDGNLQTFPNTGKGIKKYISYLKKAQPDLVTMEATGKYHRKAFRMISEAGFPVLVAQPRRVRSFSEGLGYIAKTDSIDARCIALYGQKSDLSPTELPSEEQGYLKELVIRHCQLSDLIAEEKNRLSSAVDRLKKSSRRIIKNLTQESERIKKDILDYIKEREDLKQKLELLTSAKGVGDKVAAVLIACLPELGKVNKKEIAALCGVAAYNKDSGNSKKENQRNIYGGRTVVRSALYMAALSASRYDPFLSSFYNRLVNEGKAKRLALTAVMRKLVIQLNCMLRDGTEWNPDLPMKKA